MSANSQLPSLLPPRFIAARCGLVSAAGEARHARTLLTDRGAVLQLSGVEGTLALSALSEGDEVGLCLPGASGEPGDELAVTVAWVDRERSARRWNLGLSFEATPSEERAALEELLCDVRRNVLVVDDERLNRELVARGLGAQFRIHACDSGAQALARCAEREFAVIVTDHRMPGMTGLEFLASLSSVGAQPQPQKIVVSAYPELGEIQRFINEGDIHHYMTKPVRMRELVRVVERSLGAYNLGLENAYLQAELRAANARLRSENRSLRRQAERKPGVFSDIVGHTSALQEILHTVEQVALSAAPVLLRGETGTGKELLARAVHAASPRHDKPFVAVNCAALPETLLESELFGHERGAFTGATERHLGRFERAHGGTLFVDEVGDLPAPVQVKLLRVLQEGQVERLGGSEPVNVDVRLVAATHRDLEAMMVDGSFREDLFYRINVVPIFIPPLRERRPDIWPLATHYLDEIQRRAGKEGITLSPRMREAMEQHAWPGNIRELVNLMERTVALTPSFGQADLALQRERPSDGETNGQGRQNFGVVYPTGIREAVAAFEKQHVERALRQTNGNRTRAAKELGISRQALAQKLNKYEIG